MSRFGMKLQDAAKLLKISSRKMVNILKDEGVILNTNGRNIPIPMYVQKGWFIVENISFPIKHANGAESKFITQTVNATNKGFYEIERLILNNKFNTYRSGNLFKDLEIFIKDFFRAKKPNVEQDTINVENENYVEIYHSTKKKTELILKYTKDDNIIWIPKLTI